jgi:hypothetical protein
MVEELSLAFVLEECLQAMEQGETDLDRLVGRYPDSRDEIRPLLEIAQQLRERGVFGSPMSQDFHEELRQRLMSHPG